MRFSTLSHVAALLITGSFAVPAPIPTSIHVPVSQDPSPPRPFPAGRIVEIKDPSPPRPFPKYPLEGASPIEERDPSALSRFPTDGEDEAHDPSPPRPFPAGRIVEIKDPSPPRPFPKYPLEGASPLEERDPSALSRFPTDGEDEAHDPSPPRPFPAGRIVEVENPSPSLEERDPSAPHKLVESYPIATDPSPPRPFPKYALDGGNPLEERDPLSRFPDDGEKEAADPSPPRPFPAGHVVEAKDPSSASDTIEPRSPSPLLRNAEGAEAEANDPSPPRPFPAGHPVDVEARELPPHRGHGGYFPPSNPPVSLPTAAATEADHVNTGLDTTLSSIRRRTHSVWIEDQDPYPAPTAGALWRPHTPAGEPWDWEPTVPNPPSEIPHKPTTTATTIHNPLPVLTLSLRPPPTASPSTTTSNPFDLPTCTATLISVNYHHPSVTGTLTVHNATVTRRFTVDCEGCLTLKIQTVDIGSAPPVTASRPTVTDAGTTTEYVPRCSPWIM